MKPREDHVYKPRDGNEDVLQQGNEGGVGNKFPKNGELGQARYRSLNGENILKESICMSEFENCV